MEKKQLTTVNACLTESTTPEARPLGYKPTPMPRKRRSCESQTDSSTKTKPKVTLVGDSMVRGCGRVLSSKLPSHDTCVLSTSGLKLNEVISTIPDVAKEHSVQDTLIIHIGTNDVEQHSTTDILNNFENLISHAESNAPGANIIVTALANRFESDTAEINKKIIILYNDLKKLCSRKVRCKLVECNPPLMERHYKQDGLHFSYQGTNYFANHLAQIVLDPIKV